METGASLMGAVTAALDTVIDWVGTVVTAVLTGELSPSCPCWRLVFPFLPLCWALRLLSLLPGVPKECIRYAPEASRRPPPGRITKGVLWLFLSISVSPAVVKLPG